ncbi:hypothetical protein L210DRAFT_3638836 [Boletus edulis BED1]|uniref:Uncharacterized protein n=1 Tax=Boletus edulis BED1 TaxID=1328754 RepID=A0AAD4GN16_BOLED|nr:hypothetical protein L210DRAFT_3638836 [Boletus edulis BED1]
MSATFCSPASLSPLALARVQSAQCMEISDFVFTHPEPAKGSPAGDGILGSDKEIVLLRGTEGAVNSITRGGAPFLFLIPQASSFGQVMFLASIGVSALYNAWLSSFDKEKINRKLLFQGVLASPTLTKYTLVTHTNVVVFMLLVSQPQVPTKLLDELLPNDTRVWKQWKATILERLHQPSDQAFQFAGKAGDLNGFEAALRGRTGGLQWL